MAPTKPPQPKRKYYTVDEANRALVLVRPIVEDVVRQFRTVNELKQRLSAVVTEHRRPASDPYSEELAHTQAELEKQEAELGRYINELTELGVELKGPDGLCDFYSLL